MKKIVTLMKTTYDFKRQIKKCLKHDVGSAEYTLSKYYEDYFENLEDEKITSAHIDALAKEVEEKRLQHQNSEDIQQLLSSMLKFMDALKLVVK